MDPPGMKILLKQEGNDLPIATMEVGETFTPNKPLETLKCYGTSQLEHPGEFGEGGASIDEVSHVMRDEYMYPRDYLVGVHGYLRFVPSFC